MSQRFVNETRQIIDAWTALPDTPRRARPNDRRLVRSYLAEGTSVRDLIDAMFLASARRIIRDGPPLPPIRSFAYYRPVLDELRHEPFNDSYRHYLERKLAAAQPAATVQKSASSGER